MKELFRNILQKITDANAIKDVAKQGKGSRLFIMEWAKTFYIPLVFLSIFFLYYFIIIGDDPNRDLKVITYNEFLEEVDQGNVDSVSIDRYNYNRVMIFDKDDGESYRTIYYTEDNLAEIAKLGVDIREDFHPTKESDLAFVFMNALLYTALIVLFKFMMSGSASKDSDHDNILFKKQKITFNDIKGIEEAKGEFQEIIDIFKDHDEYERKGIRVPRGILLFGPPGTGKTLLAKAAAHESKATFIAATGSSFVQMFVGMGALRVRQQFKKARKAKPTIIFIDEIDALCVKREGSGASTEHNSTVNAVLAEMDGFKPNDNILVIGATNKPEAIDDAVKRPGRFDRHIFIGKPSVEGREDLFNLYLNKLNKGNDIDVKRLAHSTTGLTPAQIAFIANESAIMSVRSGSEHITMAHIEMARDRMLLGYENKTRIILPEEKKISAIHEAGHAIGTFITSDKTYVDKISIIPRGVSAGHTLVLDKSDRLFQSRKDLLSTIKVLLSGRAAEEVMLGKENITNGAQNDIVRATELASGFVKDFGFGEIGTIHIPSHEPLKTSLLFDEADREVKKLINALYIASVALVEANKEMLIGLSDELFEREALSREEAAEILSKFEVKK